MKINSFGFIGIASTIHGSTIARQVLKAGLRPKFALISASHDEQLAYCRPFWNNSTWLERDIRIPRKLNWGAPTLLKWLRMMWRSRRNPCFLIGEIFRHFKVPYLYVPGFESPETISLINENAVDALILAESPILKGALINNISPVIINFHPAPLPAYRGNYATYWTLYHDDPLYVTAHIVDTGVDTGPIIEKLEVPVKPGDTLEKIDTRCVDYCGKLAASLMRKAASEEIELKPQEKWQGRTFRGRMPGDILKELKRRFKNGEYTHYEREREQA